jgi:hypothetical protein
MQIFMIMVTKLKTSNINPLPSLRRVGMRKKKEMTHL